MNEGTLVRKIFAKMERLKKPKPETRGCPSERRKDMKTKELEV